MCIRDSNEDVPEESQVVSMDELLSQGAPFSVYNDIREKLLARGIPADQVRFIHEANTDAKKDKLFEMCIRDSFASRLMCKSEALNAIAFSTRSLKYMKSSQMHYD